MRREFPTSIYVGWPKPAPKPSYRKANMLDIVRAEKRVKAKTEELERRERALATREEYRKKGLRVA